METGERRTIGEKVMRERKKKERQPDRQRKIDRETATERYTDRKTETSCRQREGAKRREKGRENVGGIMEEGRELGREALSRKFKSLSRYL